MNHAAFIPPKYREKPLARAALSLPWQGAYEITIGEHYVDIWVEDERIHSRVRRFPDCLSKELHYAWLILVGKFKVDEHDMRAHPVGADFSHAS